MGRGNIANLGKYAHPKGGHPALAPKAAAPAPKAAPARRIPLAKPMGAQPTVPYRQAAVPSLEVPTPPPQSGLFAKPPFVLGLPPKRRGRGGVA